MPVLRSIRERFRAEQPLDGVKVAACLHVTAETANLMQALTAGGAEVALCSANPLTTQDEVAAALVDLGVPVQARRGEDVESYARARARARRLAAGHHARRRRRPAHPDPRARPGREGRRPEETTTGTLRLRRLEAEGRLACPVVAVNESRTERTFNDRYGTGQSALDGILRATNLLLAGRTLVLFGYGATGKGIAQRARGAGATVIVCEVDPLRALEARMDAFEVMPALDAAERGDLFVTVTGSRSVLRREHLERMRDGAVLANAGHFDVEIDLDDLRELAAGRVRQVLPLVEEYDLGDRRVHLLASGRVVNLAAGAGPSGRGDGHELREPRARGRAPDAGRRAAREPRAAGAEGDRRGDRAPQAGVARRGDRLADARAAGVPQLLGHGPPKLTKPTGARLMVARMDTSKLTTGDIIAGVGGIVLLISLFLPWYGVSVDVAGFSASESGSGWEVLGSIDILLFLIAVAAIALVLARAAGALPADIPAPVVLLGLGALAVLLVLYRIIDIPTEGDVPDAGRPEPQDRNLHRAARRRGGRVRRLAHEHGDTGRARGRAGRGAAAPAPRRLSRSTTADGGPRGGPPSAVGAERRAGRPAGAA